MQNWNTPFVAISAMVFWSGGAIVDAQPVTQTMEIVAADGNGSDRFGDAVAISGNTAIVGARFKEYPTRTGAAYLFDTTTGQQLFKLLPDSNDPLQYFGEFVAISGNNAIVSVRRTDQSLPGAYVFNVTTGQQRFILRPEGFTPANVWGPEVAISGDTAILTGEDADDPARQLVYVFDIITGEQLFILRPSDNLTTPSYFGRSVAMHGDIAIVGATDIQGRGGPPGAAYLFDTNTGQQLLKLVPDDSATDDGFGFEVAIHGAHALVRANTWVDPGGAPGACGITTAYIFDTATGQQLHKLIPSNNFGCTELDGGGVPWGGTVAINESVAIFGLYHFGNGDNLGAGTAFVYDISTGAELSEFDANDPDDMSDSFGDVGINGSTIIAGAAAGNGISNDTGAAYLYELNFCPADLNNDNTIDTADLGILLAQFNTPGPTADLNNDGVVDTADLGILLGAFGTACP